MGTKKLHSNDINSMKLKSAAVTVHVIGTIHEVLDSIHHTGKVPQRLELHPVEINSMELGTKSYI